MNFKETIYGNSYLLGKDVYVNGKHIPTDIYYNGFWNVLFFKPERAEFKLRNTNYIVN